MAAFAWHKALEASSGTLFLLGLCGSEIAPVKSKRAALEGRISHKRGSEIRLWSNMRTGAS